MCRPTSIPFATGLAHSVVSVTSLFSSASFLSFMPSVMSYTRNCFTVFIGGPRARTLSIFAYLLMHSAIDLYIFTIALVHGYSYCTFYFPIRTAVFECERSRSRAGCRSPGTWTSTFVNIEVRSASLWFLA